MVILMTLLESKGTIVGRFVTLRLQIYSLYRIYITIIVFKCDFVCICDFRMGDPSYDDLNDWDPMRESFYDESFNSYNTGAGSRLPRHQQPANLKCVQSNLLSFIQLLDSNYRLDFVLFLIYLHVFIHRKKESQPTKLHVFPLSKNYTEVRLS